MFRFPYILPVLLCLFARVSAGEPGGRVLVASARVEASAAIATGGGHSAEARAIFRTARVFLAPGSNHPRAAQFYHGPETDGKPVLESAARSSDHGSHGLSRIGASRGAFSHLCPSVRSVVFKTHAVVGRFMEVLAVFRATRVSILSGLGSCVLKSWVFSGPVTYQAQYEAFGTRKSEAGAAVGRQRANTKDEHGRRLVARADWPEASPERGDLAMSGQNHQHPTGLLNEGFRYRDLEAGIFITRDPMGFVDGPNVYTYVRQNPWTMFDPLGLSTVLGNDGDFHIGDGGLYQPKWSDPERDDEVARYSEEAQIRADIADHVKKNHERYRQEEREANDMLFLLVHEHMRKTGEPLDRGQLQFIKEQSKMTGALADVMDGWIKSAAEGEFNWSVLSMTGAGLGWIAAAAEPSPFGESLMGAKTTSSGVTATARGVFGKQAANSAPRAFWMGKDGLQAAQAAGYQTMQSSEKALAAARSGDLSLLRAESAAWAKGASGEMPVFVGKAAQAGKGGDIFWESELPILLDKVNEGAGTIKYNFLK